MTSGSVDWQIQHCREIQEKSGPFLRSLASATPLEGFLWLCSRARAVLTVDGAASHLGSAFAVNNLTSLAHKLKAGIIRPTEAYPFRRRLPRSYLPAAQPLCRRGH